MADCYCGSSEAILGSHHTSAVHPGTSLLRATAGNSGEDDHIFQKNVVDFHYGMTSSSASVTADYSNFAVAPSFDETVASLTASGGKSEAFGSRVGRLPRPCKAPNR